MRRADLAREAGLVFLLVVIPAAAYLNSLEGEFVFDDSRIYNNPAIRLNTFSPTGAVHAATTMEPATRPVANLTFVLNYLVHQFSVRGYHLVNLGIHIAAGILLYFFLRTIFTQPALMNRCRFPCLIAFFSALLWLVHPLQTQAVSYIIQRMTSLSALFFLLSLLLYARGRLARGFNGRFLLLGGSLGSWLLALGSKETAVMLPAFVLLYEWFFVQDLQRDWLRKNSLYLLAVATILVIVSLLFLGNHPWQVLAGWYGARDFTAYQRVMTEFRVMFLYLGLLVFPHPSRLSLEHDLLLSSSPLDPATTLLAIVAVFCLIGAAVFLAPKYRLLSFGILWFFGNHLVEGTILPLELVFEHRNYLPSMLLFPPLLIWLTGLSSSRKILAALTCIPVAVFSYWTFQRNEVWQDRVSLWSDCVRKAPGSARSHNNLAVALKSRGEYREAMAHYRETIRLDPGFVEAYYNMGNIMMLTGDLAQAISYYSHAVQRNPAAAVLQQSLANALFDSNRFGEAKHYYQQVLRIEPGNIEARRDLERTVQMLRYQEQRRQQKRLPPTSPGN